MVKLYFPPRYSKSNVSLQVLDKVTKMIGGFDSFARAKVIHSAAVALKKDNKLYQININEHSPQSENDYFLLSFLRTYSDCIITTGKILREEDQAFSD